MRKIIPIILILGILGISIYSYIKKDNDEPIITEIDISKEDVMEKVYEEGNTENSGGASSVYVENIEKINEFLDLDMMLRYKELLIVYGLTLPDIVSDDVAGHYEINKELIFEIFGISTLNGYEKVNYLLNNSAVNKDDNLSFIKINDLIQEGNLLKANISYFYDGKEVMIFHYIHYVFIDGKPELFIYDLEVDSVE